MNVMLDKGAYMPERAHTFDAGLDLRTPKPVTIRAGGSAVIDTGVHVQIPEGWVGMLKSKSGLNVRCGVTSEGVIDCGYTGSIVVKLYNHGSEPVGFEIGDKVSQLVVLPVYIASDLTLVNKFESTERGDKGFGSTGR